MTSVRRHAAGTSASLRDGIAILAMGLVFCARSGLAEEPPAPLPHTANPHSWVLNLPQDDVPVFSGQLEFEGAYVGMQSMLYPAPNAAGLLAAVVTHGLILESQKDSQRKKAKENADRVLDAYRPLLATLSLQQLSQGWLSRGQPGAARRLGGATPSSGDDDWLIEVVPVFLMAQDQRTLIMDTVVSVRPPAAAGVSGFSGRIRVFSGSESDKDPAGAWLANEGRKLKEVSAWLLMESLDMATHAAEGNMGEAGPFRTIRYIEGGTEKMERAQLISEQCGRLVIRNLRGEFMSVPARPPGLGGTADMRCTPG